MKIAKNQTTELLVKWKSKQKQAQDEKANSIVRQLLPWQFFAILILFFQRLPSQMDTVHKSSALLGPGIGLLGMLDNRCR